MCYNSNNLGIDKKKGGESKMKTFVLPFSFVKSSVVCKVRFGGNDESIFDS